MDYKSGFKEVGKGFINFGVAVLVFLILQPFVSEKLNITYIAIALILYIISTTIGFLLTSFGGSSNE
jgi:high-affinity K+ transport system ATPase subunit B